MAAAEEFTADLPSFEVTISSSQKQKEREQQRKEELNSLNKVLERRIDFKKANSITKDNITTEILKEIRSTLFSFTAYISYSSYRYVQQESLILLYISDKVLDDIDSYKEDIYVLFAAIFLFLDTHHF